MNKSMIRYSVSRLVAFGGTLMFVPILVGLIYGESINSLMPFIKSIFIIYLIFLYPALKKPEDSNIYIKEGMITTSLGWILMSFFGGLPFYFSGTVPTLVDSFFEAASGFTTTGSTVIMNVEALNHSLLFWRSFTHFIGGMGVLVLAVAILPGISVSSVQLMKAEVPGPKFGKLVPKLKDTARMLYIIYGVLTTVLIVVLMFAGMPIFDSIVNAFSTAGTGGFAIYNDSIAAYNSPLIEIILAISMLTFGISFNLFYLFLLKRTVSVFKNEELRIYLLIVAIATGLILWDIRHIYQGQLLTGVKDAFFTVSTIITTTGFATIDFDIWPATSKAIIIFLMMIGGCAGSTAGGLKVSRVAILFKSAKNQIKKVLSPRQVVSVHYEDKPLEKSMVNNVKNYYIVYSFLLVFIILLNSFHNLELDAIVSSSISCFNNVGPGLGSLGPTLNYALIPWTSKLILATAMIAGRLEIFPILILFLPSTWREP